MLSNSGSKYGSQECQCRICKVEQMRFILMHKKPSFHWKEIEMSLLSYVYHVHLEIKCSITSV